VTSLALALLLLWSADEERLRSAKALVFDRQYAEARAAWQDILRSSTGEEAATAAYWVARCSENLKEDARALEEYQGFLERRPRDASLLEEARSSRVALAARLYQAGQRQHLPVIQGALSDPSRNVRYFAAFKLAELGRPPANEALPILKQILAQEKDPDIVARAKVLLLGLDPQALAGTPVPQVQPKPGASPGPARVRFLRVRVFEGGRTQPNVSINVPLSLAEFAYKGLPDDAKRELKQQGYDADNFWERLKELGPTEILTVEGKDGEKVQIWIE
jgi:tetratricopeptide (TPR) repeat protein